ncbi:hypothetical protein ACFL5Q_02090 [Planctomycetota bacterium]
MSTNNANGDSNVSEHANPMHVWWKVLISFASTSLIIVHLWWPELPVDNTVLLLFLLALLPWSVVWLASIVESIEVAGVGRLQLREKVEKVETEQNRQREIMKKLSFLVKQAVTEKELAHLRKLGTGEDFPFQKDNTTSFFEAELRRLRAGKLIAGQKGKGIRTMLNEGGQVHDHFFITDRGKEYLKLRDEVEHESQS